MFGFFWDLFDPFHDQESDPQSKSTYHDDTDDKSDSIQPLFKRIDRYTTKVS